MRGKASAARERAQPARVAAHRRQRVPSGPTGAARPRHNAERTRDRVSRAFHWNGSRHKGAESPARCGRRRANGTGHVELRGGHGRGRGTTRDVGPFRRGVRPRATRHRACLSAARVDDLPAPGVPATPRGRAAARWGPHLCNDLRLADGRGRSASHAPGSSRARSAPARATSLGGSSGAAPPRSSKLSPPSRARRGPRCRAEPLASHGHGGVIDGGEVMAVLVSTGTAPRAAVAATSVRERAAAAGTRPRTSMATLSLGAIA